MLVVITEVTVKLVPKPQLARCIMASFDDIRNGVPEDTASRVTKSKAALDALFKKK
jgi:FAD/FMN-containing dehydrogenase